MSVCKPCSIPTKKTQYRSGNSSRLHSRGTYPGHGVEATVATRDSKEMTTATQGLFRCQPPSSSAILLLWVCPSLPSLLLSCICVLGFGFLAKMSLVVCYLMTTSVPWPNRYRHQSKIDSFNSSFLLPVGQLPPVQPIHCGPRSFHTRTKTKESRTRWHDLCCI